MGSWAGQVHFCPMTWDAVNGFPALPCAPTGIWGLAKRGAESGRPARPWRLPWSLVLYFWGHDPESGHR